MGITDYPGKTLLKRDTEIAKNYLTEKELNLLNRLVTAYLEVAEIQPLNRVPMSMQDWIERLNQFLTMTGRGLLTHAGNISHDAAMEKANQEYDKFKAKQLEEPAAVEKHFIEAEEKIKDITAVSGKKGDQHE